jgi:hypothetical protein
MQASADDLRAAAILLDEPIEATCAACGDQCVVPADEDPDDTLCALCAQDEMDSVPCDDCGAPWGEPCDPDVEH